MRPIYLILTVIGIALPSYFVLLESLETGNYLLYRDIPATLQSMFNNRISTIFAIDLLFGVMVFIFWSWSEKRLSTKRLLVVWLVTILLGFAGGFPLYLGWRERA